MIATTVLVALAAAGGFAALAWLTVLVDPARPWDLRPVGEDEPVPSVPPAWPRVAIVVPARNEAEALPRTLPALLAQDYPGAWEVVVVDDRSTDGTAEVARALSSGGVRLTVVQGDPLPRGWAGKVWALEQGCAVAMRRAPELPRYLLLTDADIRHSPASLRRLVAESEAAGLALNSRMARLRSETVAERLLIPPFAFFFSLLYPMRQVNARDSRVSAAAGGCMLIRTEALHRAGGLAAIKGEIIDDVNLARRVKAADGPIRLATSRSDVVSVRPYGSVGAVWRMVRRTAFDELRYSWVRLAATVLALVLLFPLPPALVVLAAVLGSSGAAAPAWALAVGGTGLAAWSIMTAVFLRTVAFFGLPRPWALTLPLAGILYGGMTLDSARKHLEGSRRAW